MAEVDSSQGPPFDAATDLRYVEPVGLLLENRKQERPVVFGLKLSPIEAVAARRFVGRCEGRGASSEGSDRPLAWCRCG